MDDFIRVTGARIHNLKNIDVVIPKGKLTVITGVSGSGKSSLAFDTIYEEGKKRYLTFSNTQFIDDGKTVFDEITGLSPTVAVEQRITRQSNPRSTVGTRTKLSNMLATLFTLYGKQENDCNEGLEISMFLKNSPLGMCQKCMGKKTLWVIDNGSDYIEKILGDTSRSVSIHCMDEDYLRVYNVDPNQPINTLSDEQLSALKYGSAKTSYEGICVLAWWWRDGSRKGMHKAPCSKCSGTGLSESARQTTLSGKTITELENIYIKELAEFIRDSGLQNNKIIKEILFKLDCMTNVGLHHLALSRPIPTLSGGEIQRLFLASFIFANLDSIIFVLDEPTIGLHEIEKEKLIEIVNDLVKRGNTVVAVEHDENFMHAADHIIDLGPHAGEFGGERIFQGTYTKFMECNNSLTAPYLSGKSSLLLTKQNKNINKANILSLINCNLHNLHNVSVDIPLGMMVGIAGVSGSGKSSLITDTLVLKLKETLKKKIVADGVREEGDEEIDIDLSATIIKGTEHIKKCVVVDQRPIGRSRTSCPATYTGVMDRIRTLFAKENNIDAGMFSLNSAGGCKKCKGEGEIRIHLGQLNYIYVECEECSGKGFVKEALSYKLDGKNILEVLEMSVHNAINYFSPKDKSIAEMLQTLEHVGLGYITLGQKTPTISGGEAQRIKLASELGKSGRINDNLYILDEPTTGLAFADIERLLNLMEQLVTSGASVIVTEHDPAVLSNCDYIIEVGPGGGTDGGHIIATGTPDELKKNAKSIVGKYLLI